MSPETSLCCLQETPQAQIVPPSRHWEYGFPYRRRRTVLVGGQSVDLDCIERPNPRLWCCVTENINQGWQAYAPKPGRFIPPILVLVHRGHCPCGCGMTGEIYGLASEHTRPRRWQEDDGGVSWELLVLKVRIVPVNQLAACLRDGAIVLEPDPEELRKLDPENRLFDSFDTWQYMTYGLLIESLRRGFVCQKGGIA